MKLTNTFICITCFLFNFIITKAQPGSLDATFGTGGKVVTSFGNGIFSAALAVGIQADGKIVVAGTYSTNTSDNTASDFAVVRYNTDGSLDNSFSTDGMTTAAVGTLGDNAKALVIQPDGKILVAGNSHNGTNEDFSVVRFTSSGVLDNTFGTGGRVILDVGTCDNFGNAIALQSDGKIVMAGDITFNDLKYVCILRLNANGTIDNTFGTLGGAEATTFGTTANAFGTSVAIQSDGKIVVGGYVNIDDSYDNFMVIRYTSTGTLDATFGSLGGAEVTSLGDYDADATGVLIQSNGKIVLTGYLSSPFLNDYALVRYDNAGAVDLSFGTNGLTTTATGEIEAAYAATLQNDDKILVTGDIATGDEINISLHRYNSNGAIDNSFGTNGIVGTHFTGIDSYGHAIAIGNDGKIIVVGYGGISNDFLFDFIVARYNSDLPIGLLDQTDMNAVSIYPNPSNGKFDLRIDDSSGKIANTKLEIFNLAGQKVFNTNQPSEQIDLSHAPKGTYTAKVYSGEKVFVKNVVLE